MLSQYLIGLGFVPQRLPQQKAAGAKKSMLIGSHPGPTSGINSGKYRYTLTPLFRPMVRVPISPAPASIVDKSVVQASSAGRQSNVMPPKASGLTIPISTDHRYCYRHTEYAPALVQPAATPTGSSVDIQ